MVAKSQTRLSNFHLSLTSPTRGCLNFLPSAGSQQTFGDMGVPIREDLGLWEPLRSCLVCARNQEGPKALRVTPSPGLTAAAGGQTQPGSHRATSHSHVLHGVACAAPKGGLAAILLCHSPVALQASVVQQKNGYKDGTHIISVYYGDPMRQCM